MPSRHPNWGGRRPGAGRPPTLSKKRITAIALSPALLQELDKLRGSMSRSAFIEQLLRDALAGRQTEQP